MKEFTKTLRVKDNKPYLIIVSILLLITVLIVVLKNPFFTNDTEFAIKDPDEITKIVLDDKNRTLTLELTEAEIARRMAELPPWEPAVRSGYLRRYAQAVTSASTGAVFRE